MLNSITLAWGILAICGMFIGFIPCLGSLNWLNIPFADLKTTDTVTGKTDWRLRRCEESNTCPKTFEVNSANEWWAKAGKAKVAAAIAATPKVLTFIARAPLLFLNIGGACSAESLEPTR